MLVVVRQHGAARSAAEETPAENEDTPVPVSPTLKPLKCRAYQRRDIESIPQLSTMSPDERMVMRAVSAVLPFRVNKYVTDELIDWDNVPDDPIYLSDSRFGG